MKPHKLSAFVFSAILVASQISFSAQAQEVLPKGIVFYKTSSAANSDTAQAREYQSLEPAPVVVNGISLEGAEFTIQRNRLVEVITYPNLRTIRTPAEIEALKEAGRKLTNAKSAYPLATTVIEPRLAAFTEVANKLNQGMVLVGGEWQKSATEQSVMNKGITSEEAATSNKRILKTKSGKSYELRKINSFSGDHIGIQHSVGVTTIALDSLTDESLALLDQDADYKRLKSELEASAVEMTAQQLAAAEKVIDELGEKRDKWKDAIIKEDREKELTELALLVESKKAKFDDWKLSLFGFSGEKTTAFSAVTEIVGKPDVAEKRSFGSMKWTSDEAVRCRYFDAYVNEITGKTDSLTIIAIPALDAIISIAGDSGEEADGGFESVFVPYQAYWEMLLGLADPLSDLETSQLMKLGVEIPLILELTNEKEYTTEARMGLLEARTKLRILKSVLGISNKIDEIRTANQE